MASNPRVDQQDSIRQAGVILCQFRREPDGGYTVPYASEAAQAVLGIAAGTPYPNATALFAAVHPDDHAGLLDALSASAADLSSCHREVRLNGVPARWLSAYCVPQREADGATLWHGQFTDVTALKQAALALQASEERLQLAVNSGQIGVWEYDVRSQALDWDDSMFALYGARRQDFSGAYDAWASRLHPDDRAATEAALQSAIEGRSEYMPDFRVVWPGGQVHHIKGHARVVRDAQGNALRMVGTNWDNSVYADAQRRLQFARAAIEKSQSAFFWTDIEGKIVYANDFACTNLGYAPGELIGWPLDALVANLDMAAWRARWAAADQLSTQPRLSQHRGKDGSLRQVEVTSHRIVVGTETYVFSFVQDVGERLAAAARQTALESQLLASRQLFESMVEHMPVVVFLKRASDLRIELVNRAAEQFFGYSRSQLLGKTNHDLWPGTEGDAFTAADRAVLASPEVLDIPQEAVTGADGQTRYLHTWKVALRDAQGVPTHLLGIAADITASLQSLVREALLEDQLRESQKMEAIGTLAGGIAHDFNNALATILGNLELARQDTLGNPSAQESLKEIHKAGTRARELVQQILAFSRRQPSERTRLDLAAVVQESVRLLRSSAPARLEIRVHCAASVPPVLGNAAQLEQVILNLGTNAMQAMHEGVGSIVVSLDTVLLDAALAESQSPLSTLYQQHPGLTVRLSVADTGPGMDTPIRERIFEPFFTTKPVGEGTGLGLSVVHGIVRGHGGVITVQSQPGRGTTFTLYLPVAEGSVDAPESRPEAVVPLPLAGLHGERRILYVDDDEALLFLVKRLLERRGYFVSIYQDAQAALAALRADPSAFDLVLTDYNMPRLSGLDVAREARAIRPDLAVAVASGFLDETLRAQASQAGVSKLIFKADNVEDFCAMVQHLAELPPLAG
jgi:PAS domain S-box-containing protein